MDARPDDQREDQERPRPNHQVHAGVHQEVDLAHVVGGAGHDLADGLAVVKGHALADQAGV
jgi:hypothetical protein